ncbi:MAG: RNA-binding S4 domain-containing protein [Hydrogenophaga sp.]|jgi:ribosome-associated heat shock protein Hsp15|nr:RNA-binding S4 domain-containing protein [Hydrogenophaga sp.]
MPHTGDTATRIRLDKWLWAARFYKTRGLSQDEIDKGRVQVNGQAVKPAREVHLGDAIELRIGPVVRTVIVRALSGTRGPASVAAHLYEETAESVAQRLAAAEQRRLAPEPAHTIEQGRPTKRDRRDMQALRSPDPAGRWGDRWSASHDEH